MNPNTFIIAEAGVNHNGSVKLARKLVDAAADAGADAVKFQTFKAEHLATQTAVKAEYQKVTTGTGESQFDMLKKLELDIEAHKELYQYCRQKKIIFLSSPFDVESVELLHNLGLNIFKIPSGEITNLPYLRKIGELKKFVILSTGMSVLDEIKDALNVLLDSGTLLENISVLHCNTEYPTPFEDVNLRAMQTIAKDFGVIVGYSDHTQGIEVPVAAVSLGAKIIEKHLTTDRSLPGPDHKASLEPDEFKAMVTAIRNVEIALGNGIKKPSFSEKKNIDVARKKIVAKFQIVKGEIFSEENLTVKRSGPSGLSPMLWDNIIGRKAKRVFQQDEMIEL